LRSATHDARPRPRILAQLQRKAADPEILAAGIRNLFKLSTSLMSIMILADDLQHYEDINQAHAQAEQKLKRTNSEVAAAEKRVAELEGHERSLLDSVTATKAVITAGEARLGFLQWSNVTSD
jgi:hypothetical protein